MELAVAVLRYRLTPDRALAVPAEKYANVIRGALGLALGPEEYARLFTGELYAGRAPGGMKSAPRPFVLRVEGVGGEIGLRVHLLGERAAEWAPALGAAVERMGETGLGPGRVGVRVERLGEPERHVAPLGRLEGAPERIRVSFLTPTELKTGGAVAAGAPFAALFARARDRVLYFAGGGGEHGALARDLAGLAGAVRDAGERLTRVVVERVSTRTGERHGIGGFTGWADYEGDFRALLPWLRAAEWTGVGRQTVWGKGAIRCSAAPDAAGGGGG